MTLLLVYFFVAIIISFLCSVLEAVLLSITPSYAALLKETDPKTSTRLKGLKANIDKPLSAILTLNTISHTVGAAGVGAQVSVVYGSNYLAVSSAILTLLILVFSEIVPKTLGATYWRGLTPISTKILPIMIFILFPFIWLSDLITKRISKGKTDGNLRAEIRALAKMGQDVGALKESESQILRNLLELEKLSVVDIMTPRTVMDTLCADTKIKDYGKNEMDKAFSRIPIYKKNDSDHIVSFVRKQDVLVAKLADKNSQETIGSLARDLALLPESLTVRHVYDHFLRSRVPIAGVVNEYGDIKGLVTMEDVIETMLGQEIIDESDKHTDMQRLAKFQWMRKLQNNEKKHK